MITKEFKLYGFTVYLYDYGYAQYLYPSFNKNAEFKVGKKQFKELSRYLRNCRWALTLNKSVKFYEF